MTGRIDWSMFIQKVLEAFDRKIKNIIFDSFTTAPTKLTPASRWVLSIDGDADDYNDVMELLSDLEGITGDEIIMIGTKPALGRLNKVSEIEWSNEMSNEMNLRGQLGHWEGHTLLAIEQVFADGSDGAVADRKLSHKEILLMPATENKFVKFFNEGDARVQEVTDSSVNMDMTVEYEYQQKMGVAVVLNKKFGQIKFN